MYPRGKTYKCQQSIHTSTQKLGRVLYSFFNLGARWVWVVNVTPRPFYSRETPGTHSIGGWVCLRAGLDGCGKSRLHRDSIPDLPVHSKSLYRSSYPGPLHIEYTSEYMETLLSSFLKTRCRVFLYPVLGSSSHPPPPFPPPPPFFYLFPQGSLRF
jgi:hypothetical protein